MFAGRRVNGSRVDKRGVARASQMAGNEWA